MGDEEKKEEEKKGDEEEEKKVGKFTHGDHMVHIFIQQGKKFVPPCEGDRTCNVLVEVETNGLTEYAPCKDDVAANMDSITTWGDHLFFEMRNLDPEEAKGVSVTVKVQNKGFLKNEMIGLFQFEMSKVYFSPDHKIEHVWLALQNPDGEDASQITGMLKISASVQGPNDEQVKLEAEQGPEPKDPKMMMSASSKRTYNQLKIRFIEGRDLPTFGATSFTQSLECFVRMTYGGGKPIKSDVVDQEKKICPLMQEFLIPVQTPVVSDRMLLEIFDHEKIGYDNQIGSLLFSVKKLVKKVHSVPGDSFFEWYSVYGAPPDSDNDKVADQMNDNPEMASHWRGRMLVQVFCAEDDKPKKLCQKLDPKVKEEAQEAGYFNDEEYEMFVEVGQGVALPERDKKYTVKVKIQDFAWESSKPKTSEGNYNRWHDRGENLTFKLPWNGKGPEDNPGAIDPEQRVQIYLMEGDKPISWWKGLLKNFDDVNAKYQWIQLKADKAVDEVKDDYQAGMVSIKLSVKKKEFGPHDFKSQDAWSSPPPKRMGSWKIRCYLFQCRDIPAADDDGSSDPFIRVWSCDEKKIDTKIIDDNLNPIFMTCKDVIYDFDTEEEAPPIILEVYDADIGLLTDSEDFLGRAVINIKDSHYTSDPVVIPEPKWHDIKYNVEESAPACGQILASFCVVPDDTKFQLEADQVNVGAMVETKEFKVSINVLGLRDLTPDGLLPIQKAFLRFMIKSLLDPEVAGTMQNIQTQPKDRGTSPNITTLIEFKVPLPVEKLYTPALSVTVFDEVFMGFSQPRIGSFTIPIGEIMHDNFDRQKQLLRTADSFIEMLEGGSGDGAAAANAGAEQDDNAKINVAINEGEEVDLDGIEPQMEFDKQEEVKNDNDEEEPVDDEGKANPLGATEKNKQKKANAAKINKAIGAQAKADIKKKQQHMAKMKELEKAQAQKVQKELMKETQTGAGEQTIILPVYDWDSQLSVYRECDIPNKKLFLPVGFNSQDQIRAIMKIREGDMSHEEYAQKRKEAKEHKESERKLKTEKDEDEEEEARIESEITDMTTKHYRTFYDDELENNKDIFKRMPFRNYDIMRGQSRGAKKSSWFGSDNTDESGQVSTLTKAGYFKGVIEISNLEDKQKYEKEREEKIDKIVEMLINTSKQKGEDFNFELAMLENLETKNVFANVLENIGCNFPGLLEFLTEIHIADKIKDQLVRQQEAMVHIYILEGYDFASRDIGSPSDSYLYITSGSEIIYNGRDDAQMDEANPQFNMHFEMKSEFPGSKPVVIDAYDYDLIFGDDLIGKTTVDLDDRFFTPQWQALEEKPIEARQIYHPRTSLSQGVIRMWCDIEATAKGAQSGKVWQIAAEPKSSYEVRVSVFGAKNVPAEDVEGTSDAYIRAFFDEASHVQETDTHYRNTDGKPNWNYRLLFDVNTPLEGKQILKLQCWDRDLIKSNDLICQWEIDITEMIIDCQLTGTPICLQKKYYNESLKSRLMKDADKEPFNFVKSDKEGNPDNDIILTAFHPEDPEKKKPILLKLEIRVVPRAYAESNKVGAARGEPNVEPFLPEPEGRFKLSLNPFAMLNQLCAPSMRRKIYCAVFCILCIVICFYLISPITAILQLFTMAAGG